MARPQIRKLLLDSECEEQMTNTEREAWVRFKNVVNNFLGNKKLPIIKK
jgi:hypothetical protein